MSINGHWVTVQWRNCTSRIGSSVALLVSSSSWHWIIQHFFYLARNDTPWPRISSVPLDLPICPYISTFRPKIISLRTQANEHRISSTSPPIPIIFLLSLTSPTRYLSTTTKSIRPIRISTRAWITLSRRTSTMAFFLTCTGRFSWTISTSARITGVALILRRRSRRLRRDCVMTQMASSRSGPAVVGDSTN